MTLGYYLIPITESSHDPTIQQCDGRHPGRRAAFNLLIIL